MSNIQIERRAVFLDAPRHLVKLIKVSLENQNYLNKTIKITKIPQTSDRCLLPLTQLVKPTNDTDTDAQLNLVKDRVLEEINLPHLKTEIFATVRSFGNSYDRRSHPQSMLAHAVCKWLALLPKSITSGLPIDLHSTVMAGSWTYTLYRPLMILPTSFLASGPWPDFLDGPLKDHIISLYNVICDSFRVTHIAMDGPIPIHVFDNCSKSISTKTEPNTMRLPSNLRPLYGDFGPQGLQPDKSNFEKVFWASTIQNGIYQTWAPLYTMFSRGNIREKTRLLNLKSLTANSLGKNVQESSAVDLYAGIGYFAFCYAKAGVSKVLCWELNRWSVEGFRRGAKSNKWEVKIIGDKDAEDPHIGVGEERLVLYHETNEKATARVKEMRNYIPPIRHVNCGYLPSSQGSWRSAVQILDSRKGGWIHAHENIAAEGIQRRTEEITKIFRSLASEQNSQASDSRSFDVRCEHLERVKTYAPGIVHCVVDVALMPLPPQTPP